MMFLLPSCAPDDETPAARSANATKAAPSKQPAAPVSEAGAPETPKAELSQGAETPPTDSEKAEMPASQGEAASPEARAHADRLLQFANQSREIVERDLARPAARIRENVAAYMDTWHIRHLPAHKTGADIRNRLRPEEGLFSPEEEKTLARALDGMDKALNDMLRNYRDLEKYVADNSIQDDGRQGKKLGALIERNYGQFAANQHSWLELVEKRAEEAEEIFLRSHPLQRQIAGARSIFAQFREIAALINSGKGNPHELGALRQSIEQIAADCGKPPFNASPGLERLYRGFLAKVGQYCGTLNMAVAEGLHGAQKRELNMALHECRNAYNEFVSRANFLAEQLPGRPKEVGNMTTEVPARPARTEP